MRRVSLRGYKQQHQRCLTSDKIPEEYRISDIRGHYRLPNSSLGYCVRSAFKCHNETLNFWTHFLFLPVAVVYWWTFPSHLWPVTSIPVKYYPLLSYIVNFSALFFFSSMAHLLSCASPRIVHLSLCMDYTAICVFGVGAGACTTFWYERPVDGWLLFRFLHSPQLFMFLSSATSLLACYFMCASRQRWNEYGTIIRAAATTLVFIVSHIPCEDRLVQCFFLGKDCSDGTVYVSLTYLFYLSGMFTYALKIPERWAPGKFDLIGGGHQWMHIFVGLGNLAYMAAIRTDLKERERILSLDEVTFSSSLAWVLVTLVGCLLIVLWSWQWLSPSGELKHRLKGE